jgi:hypothetical protein
MSSMSSNDLIREERALKRIELQCFTFENQVYSLNSGAKIGSLFVAGKDYPQKIEKGFQ